MSVCVQIVQHSELLYDGGMVGVEPMTCWLPASGLSITPVFHECLHS